ncbi:hypothetical protein DL96DRAFT_392519 [Flagelloscypha sp. PMI_526]|nr:hypothetical protein DL96DRAFT_392519 [Flagelloscypha sp. PMI_526]
MVSSGASGSSGSLMHLPFEVLQYIVLFIDDRVTLKAVGLTSTALVHPAQTKIFSRLALSSISATSIRSIISTPHILRYIRSVVSDVVDKELPALLSSLSNLPRLSVQTNGLRELSFTADYENNTWSTALLRSLHGKILPFLTSLTLQSMDAPLFLITSCASLQYLKVYSSIISVEADAEFSSLFDEDLAQLGITPSSLESGPMVPLTTLAIDATKNPGGRTCPIVDLIQLGRFERLKCLELEQSGSFWFPLEDLFIVLKPVMSQLVSLDIGYWERWDNLDEDHSQDLDLFQIQHYPQLQSFSTRLQSRRADRTLAEEQMCLSSRFNWLAESFEILAFPHPLRALCLRLETIWFMTGVNVGIDVSSEFGGGYQQLKKVLGRLDKALARNPNLERLEKVITPILPEFSAMRLFLQECLVTLNAAGKLSFEFADMGERFLSLP